MSVRKLTNVQEARRILRERRERCEAKAEIRLAIDRGTTGVPGGGGHPALFTEKEVASIIRQAPRKKVGWTRAVRTRGVLWPIYDVVTAYVRPTGYVHFAYNRVTPEAFKKLPDPSTAFGGKLAKTKKNAQAYFDNDRHPKGGNHERWYPYAVRPCGPCSQRELVAIDALLETGDRYAEHLAKSCRKNGGILEGLKRRRRRR